MDHSLGIRAARDDSFDFELCMTKKFQDRTIMRSTQEHTLRSFFSFADNLGFVFLGTDPDFFDDPVAAVALVA